MSSFKNAILDSQTRAEADALLGAALRLPISANTRRKVWGAYRSVVKRLPVEVKAKPVSKTKPVAVKKTTTKRKPAKVRVVKPGINELLNS